MSDLISRSALLEYGNARTIKEAVGNWDELDGKAKAAVLRYAVNLKRAIRTAPAVDAVPVVHGHWFFTEYEYFDCSVCGMAFWNGCESSKEAKEMLELGNAFNFCPNCGAKMDGGNDG